ncbi:MAG: glycoside hydrolase family 2, partial [Chitinophagaceae bacterium]
SAFSFLLLSSLHTSSQAREKISISDGWLFAKGESGRIDTATLAWSPVSLPHSWNTTDVMDDAPGYYRGVGWYKRRLKIPDFKKGKSLGLYFDGANQLATVYIDGRRTMVHTGGYTGFYVPLDNVSNEIADHEILVSVDNSYNEDIAPLTADFTFFGGLYRNAWLISTDPVHFSMGSNGAATVDITTPEVSVAKALVKVNTEVVNFSGQKRKLKVTVLVRDRDHNLVSKTENRTEIKTREKKTITVNTGAVPSPHLWSPDDPYLYSVTTSITDAATGELLDELVYPLGFRWYRFDPAEGFFLNGKALKLVGASRHQDRPWMGNAVPDVLAREDVQLLKKMGGNFLRVAHYPQDQAILEECDRLGIIASVEIPLVNEISETETFSRNAENMLREMIAQNRNHPSVVIWCLMNEIMLKPHFNNDKTRQAVYFSNIVQLAARLDSIARQTDPARYTMIANHGDFDRYNNTGLTKIAMITGWNLYSGWYGGELKDFAGFLEKHHAKLPGIPLIVSEYGADADPRIRSLAPVKFDKSVEYSLAFHQYYLNEMLKR